MAWSLNQQLSTSFSRIEDVKQKGQQLGEIAFSRYVFEDELNKARFYLISNRFSGEYLIPEQKSVDFLLMIRGTWFQNRSDELLSYIRPIPEIQTAFSIQPDRLKSRANLIWE
jgi:hypothetical protein